MARYQELKWYLGIEFVPKVGVPVFMRLSKDLNNVYRGVRVDADGATAGTLYLKWNEPQSPTSNDATPTNSFLVEEVYEWAYL